MNSVKLANETWKWARSCSLIPHSEVLKEHMRELAPTNTPEFVFMNAWRRLEKKLSDFQTAYKEMLNNMNDQTIENLGKIVRTPIKEMDLVGAEKVST